jgi:hypothetical protein
MKLETWFELHLYMNVGLLQSLHCYVDQEFNMATTTDESVTM